MTTSTSPLMVKCPTCKKQTPWVDNPFKPFCSSACKNKDFIGWANEDFKVPDHAQDEDAPFSSEVLHH